MKIARVKVTHIDMSFWGDFAARQDELRLVTLMAVHPQYRHPLSSWFPTDAMCVVEIETEDGLVGSGWCEDYAGATSVIIDGHLNKLLIGANPLDRSRLPTSVSSTTSTPLLREWQGLAAPPSWFPTCSSS